MLAKVFGSIKSIAHKKANKKNENLFLIPTPQSNKHRKYVFGKF